MRRQVAPVHVNIGFVIDRAEIQKVAACGGGAAKRGAVPHWSLVEKQPLRLRVPVAGHLEPDLVTELVLNQLHG